MDETTDSPGEESIRFARLVARACGGDRDAAGELIVNHLAEVDAWLRKNCDPRALGHESHGDVLQSVVGDLLAGLPAHEYRSQCSFRAWIFQIARNKLIDKYRYHTAQCRYVSRELGTFESDSSSQINAFAIRERSPSEAASLREDAGRLARALEKLPQDYREVLLFAQFDGLGHREIAERMGRTEMASRTLLRRALVRLSTELGRGVRGS